MSLDSMTLNLTSFADYENNQLLPRCQQSGCLCLLKSTIDSTLES